MIQFILFMAACLVLQAIKDAVTGRGKKKPRLLLALPKEAECGCQLIGSRVIKTCEAHGLLVKIQEEKL